MTGAEKGFLLLTSHFGDPDRPVLTVAQFRNLALRVRDAKREETVRDLTAEDMIAIGYDRTMAKRILNLLKEEDRLQWYLQRGKRCDCIPITRISGQYPDALRKKLGLDAPGCLWAKGNIELLNRPAVALVGSRVLREENRNFAQKVGTQAALQGYVLVSGNARGADREAQDACLAAGGQVISIVADALENHEGNSHLLYLSEDGFDLPFSSLRALSRNRVIHCLTSQTLVAQSDLGKGGTWDGTVKNLRNNWSAVFSFADGSDACRELEMMGAVSIGKADLSDFSALQSNFITITDR